MRSVRGGAPRWGAVRLAAGVPLLAAALVLAGCGSTTGATPPPPPESASPASTAGSLEATLTPVVNQAMSQLQVPGAIVYVSVPGQAPWQAALGVADLATRAPMDVADHMRIGSITKTFTATVVLQLAGEGKLSLDDPASKYAPGAPTNGATVRQLLNMTSGIFDYTNDAQFAAGVSANPTRVWTTKELLDLAGSHQPLFAPGKDIHYTNTNYILLGVIAEKVGGAPIEQLIQRRIITPLALRGCSYPPTSPAIPDPHPQGYPYGPAGGTLSGTPTHEASDQPPNNVTAISPSMAGAAGAMICTVDDLRIWTKALATGQLLTPAMQQQRLVGRDLDASGLAKYGLGIRMFSGFLGHNGQIPGFQSYAVYDPSADTTVIVLVNLAASANGSAPADAIASAIIKTLRGTSSPSPSPSLSPSPAPAPSSTSTPTASPSATPG